ncbi:MAG TPA: hypothetical protein VHR66_03935 [Gemmataceae bacterium]|jgi:hypothetical protein|nr:hypothetical protein [Gemmataceae bacterium]
MPRFRRTLRLEPLEDRRTPATLGADGKSVTFLDADGDTVTVALNKPVLTSANKDAVFHFDVGIVDGFNTVPQALQTLDLTTLGTGLKVTATAVGGDGKANIGWVKGDNIDVVAVNVSGDLGRVTVGDANTKTPGLGTLSAGTIGQFGVMTQGAGGTLLTAITGNLTKVTVKGDVTEARISVAGSIGSATIGGKLVANAANSDTGLLDATGSIGPVKITGAIVGGTGDRSGIRAGGNIKSVSVGGLTGSTGIESASIVSTGGNIGAVTITGDMQGGGGLRSASVRAPGLITQPIPNKPRVMAGGAIAAVTVKGVVTGLGPQSATVQAGRGVGKIDFGALTGGAGDGSAAVSAQWGNIGPITIRGAVQGGAGLRSASFHANGTDPGASVAADADPTNLGYGDIIANGGKITSVAVTGALNGNGGGSAAIQALRSVGAVKLAGMIGADPQSASIQTGLGGIASVRITGDVKGGPGVQSGSIMSGKALGPVTITGDLRGGDGDYSGMVAAGVSPTNTMIENIASVTVGGSIVGGKGKQSASIATTGGTIGPVKVTGNLTGGNGVQSASIRCAADYDINLVLLGGKITSVFVGGSVAGGAGLSSALIQADRGIGPVTVVHDWTAASVVSGIILAGNDGFFGSPDDSVLKASPIASINIGGVIEGTATLNDHFAFLGSQISSFTVTKVQRTLAPGPGNDVDIHLNPLTNDDVTLSEVTA